MTPRAGGPAVIDVYRETLDFYKDRLPALDDAACGFRILYGPPTVGAPTLFVGYQPGGDATHMEPHEHTGWPQVCDYAVKDWKLAKRMREVWSAEYLSSCTGLNSLFFRAPSMKAWRRIPLALRREMEQFSSVQFLKLVTVLGPARVVFIGMNQFDRFADEPTAALRQDGRLLVKQGVLMDIPAYGVIHLSGAQISRIHRAKIKTFFTDHGSGL